jgi:hypothetical protein
VPDIEDLNSFDHYEETVNTVGDSFVPYMKRTHSQGKIVVPDMSGTQPAELQRMTSWVARSSKLDVDKLGGPSSLFKKTLIS